MYGKNPDKFKTKNLFNFFQQNIANNIALESAYNIQQNNISLTLKHSMSSDVVDPFLSALCQPLYKVSVDVSQA